MQTAPGFAMLLLRSYARFVGEPLASYSGISDDEAAHQLYETAPFGLLAHDTSADPLFIYANRTAQRCFEYDWDDFVGLPSRLSALPDGQTDREALLRSVAEHHVTTGYRGLRVSKSGHRFWVENLTMWELIDDDGVRYGQAAVFRSWSDA